MTTANKGLDQPAYNSNVNTWGTGPLNTNFGYIDLALGGSTLLNATGLGGTTVALTAAQCRPLSLIISGTPGAGGGVTYTIPAGVGGQWVVRNNTVSDFRVRIQSAAGGSAVFIEVGENVQVSCDGTSSGVVRNDTIATAAGDPAEVQYNISGALAGSPNMVFNGQILTAHTLDASTGGVIFPDNTTQMTAAAPAGSTTQVQFNDGGAFAGDAGMTFNKTTNALTLTGPLTAVGATLSSTLTMSAAAINGAIRADVASATTCAIGAAASNYVRITGTTTITGLGTVASGVYRDVVFAGTLTLTYNATSLILPTAANITTAAGDTAGFVSDGSGNWRCLYYTRASGTALVALSSSRFTNSLAADVTCNNTALYFDGPSVAQGTTGTWFASGTVTVGAPQGHAVYFKLWDGTTVISSAWVTLNAANHSTAVALSGYISSPAGNIRISVRDASGTTVIYWNISGNEKDSTISAFRIA